MIKLDLAERYAKVLFKMDLKKDAFKKRLLDFENMTLLMQKSPDLQNFLQSPLISIEKKEGFLNAVLSSSFDNDFIQFLVFLIQKKRFSYIASIAKKYQDLVNKRLGIWEADLIVASPINSELESKLIYKLEEAFQKTIHVKRKIQPSIIGGSILIVSNNLIDWSITGRLNKMKESLLERKK